MFTKEKRLSVWFFTVNSRGLDFTICGEGGGIILVKRPMGGLIFGEERGMSKEK